MRAFCHKVAKDLKRLKCTDSRFWTGIQTTSSLFPLKDSREKRTAEHEHAHHVMLQIPEFIRAVML